MSTKFNRNDSSANDDEFYLGDYQGDINGIEGDLRDHTKAFHEVPCIISGFIVTVNTSDDDLFDVTAGQAFDEDAKIIIQPDDLTAVEGADIADGAINYICVRHKYSYSDSRNAYRTGVLYNTRKYDDYEIVVRTEAGGIQTGDICIATATGNGTGISISTDDRCSPDFGGTSDTNPPMKVTGVSLETGAEQSLIHPSVSSQFHANNEVVKAYITVTFNEVSDPSGISEYQVEMVPLDNSDDEQVELLSSQTIKYSAEAPGGPEYSS